MDPRWIGDIIQDVVMGVVNGDIAYGSTVINGASVLGFQPNGYWGGVENTHENPQSGIGSINNSRYETIRDETCH